jgi:hypothetical protein
VRRTPMFHTLESGRRGLRHSLVLAEGSLFAAVVCVLVSGVAARFQTRPPDVRSPLALQVIEVVVLIALSIGPSAYWVFRRVLRRGTPQEASLVARTFAVVAPIGVCIGSPLAWGVGALSIRCSLPSPRGCVSSTWELVLSGRFRWQWPLRRSQQPQS